MSRELIVPAGAATERLDVYLAGALEQTRSAVTRLHKAGDITVNGRPARPSHLVQPGDRISVKITAPANLTRAIPDLPVVYEDADLMVIDKPAGLAAHPAAGLGTQEPTVAEFARTHSTDTDPERPGIVHRLDRDTSGLMILAKTVTAKTYLQEAFRDHSVHKTYVLLATGHVDPPQAIIKLPLDRDPAHPLRRAVVPGGRPAVTRYRTLVGYPGYTLIEAKPETGRTHQLRVHFAAIGHPIAGDSQYNPATTASRDLRLKRQFLHASALDFTAPSGVRLNLHSPLPEDLQAIIQILEDRL